jgi:hypothetical protein
MIKPRNPGTHIWWYGIPHHYEEQWRIILQHDRQDP